MKHLAIALALLSLTMPAVAQKKTVAKADVPGNITPPPTPAEKPVPQELVVGLSQYNALNAAIQKIKTENGIDKLEAQLQKDGQALLAQADKDGYTFSPATNNWVEKPKPVVAPPPAIAAPPVPVPAKP